MTAETPASFSLPGEGTAMAPRLRILEATAQAHATQISLLRQLGDDLGAWRYRMDSTSNQTMEKMEALKADVKCSLEIKTRLQVVESQLTAAHALLTTQDGVNADFRVTAADLNASLAEVGATADGAAVDAAAAVTMASSTAEETVALSSQVQALRLGLEVVESSLEGLDFGDALQLLRSRVNDLDSGVAQVAQETLAQVAGVHAALEDLCRKVAANDEAAAYQALRIDTAVAALSEDIEGLRRDALLREQAMAAAFPPLSPALTTSSMRTPPSEHGHHHCHAAPDPRLKLAVSTLSDGYRSLHRAVTLMYEEQAEVAGKVAAVGAAAAQPKANHSATPVSRIRALNMASSSGATVDIASHPVAFSPCPGAGKKRRVKMEKGRQGGAVDEIVELRALLTAQAADAVREQRRAERLEAEVAEMRCLLSTLAPRAEEEEEAMEDAVEEIVEKKEKSVPQVTLIPAKSLCKSLSDRLAVSFVVNEASASVKVGIAASRSSVREEASKESLIAAVRNN